MRLFARVAEAGSFTGAARQLGVPKQTLSRRVAELERALGVQLLHRTTRSLRPSDAGAAYALRCAELVRMAEEANRAASEAQDEPRGLLRVSADPVFGEAFLGPLLVEYARRWPAVGIEVVLTRRRVELLEEGFDVAFRVGQLDDASLLGLRLGPARVRYCASPAYLARRGTPQRPAQLSAHDTLAVSSDGSNARWPFRGRRGLALVPVQARLRFSSLALARTAALAGLGIGLFPEFACAEDLRRGRLVSVLEEHVAEVGSVWLVHPAARFLSARIRAFVELARRRLAATLGTEGASRSTRKPRSPR